MSWVQFFMFYQMNSILTFCCEPGFVEIVIFYVSYDCLFNTESTLGQSQFDADQKQSDFDV